MKINAQATLKVIGKSQERSKDNTKVYYRIMVLTDDDAGRLSVPEDVYNMVDANETYDFVIQYNTEYKSLTIRELIGLHFGSDAQAPAQAPAQASAKK